MLRILRGKAGNSLAFVRRKMSISLLISTERPMENSIGYGVSEQYRDGYCQNPFRGLKAEGQVLNSAYD